MTLTLVDDGLQSSGPLNGVLSWDGGVDGNSNEMNYDGGGGIYANISFAECSNWWQTAAPSDYQYVEMAWYADFGVSSYDSIAHLYVCMSNLGGSNYAGWKATFYNDGSNGIVDIYESSGFGWNYYTSMFGSLFWQGDVLGFEYNDSTGEIGAWLNGSLLGTVADSTHAGDRIMAIGSGTGSAEFNNVYMDQPSGGGGQTVNLTGIASASAFGSPTLSPGPINTPTLTGIPSAEAFGSVGAPSQQAPGLSGIASAAAFGTIQALNQTVSLAGIPSQETFGGIGGMNEQVLVTGIPSAEAFGGVSIVGGVAEVGQATRMLMTGVGR